jgi:hypothetical protein
VSTHGNHGLEEQLRALPTALPPASLRDRILDAAQTRRAGAVRWGLAYAIGLIALIAVDVGIDHFQSACLARLMGDGRPRITARSDEALIAALRERKAMMSSLLERRPM